MTTEDNVYTLVPKATQPSQITFNTSQGPLIILYDNGTLWVDPNVKADDAALAFIDALRPHLMALYQSVKKGL